MRVGIMIKPSPWKATSVASSTLLISILVVAVGILSTIAVTWTLHSRTLENDAMKFESEVSTSVVKIKDEISKFNFGLQGTKGLIVSHKAQVSRKAFRDYAESRDFFSNFSGSLGFGFIRLVKDQDLARYEREQSVSFPGFEVKPKLDHYQHFVIELLEPIEENSPAIGLDIAFEKERLEAAQLAIDTGELVITNRVGLVQRLDKHAGFLLYLPVYKSAKTPDTVEKRREEAVGLAYTPIILESMQSELQSVLSPHIQVDFILSDGSHWPLTPWPFPYKSSLVNRKEAQIEFGGKIWKIELSRAVDLDTTLMPYTYLFSILGLLISLVLGGWVYKRLKRRDEIWQEQSLWLNAVVNNSEVAIITTNLSGRVLMINEKASSLLGLGSGSVIDILQHLSIGRMRHDPKTAEMGCEDQLSRLFHRLNHPNEEESEVFFIDSQNQHIDVSVSMGKIRGAGDDFMGYLIVASDIREMKSFQRKLEKQKAILVENSKLTLLGNMAGGVAHELNTPLAIILAKTQMLQEASAQQLPPKEYLEEGLKMIEDSAKRINRFLKNLKWFTRNSHEAIQLHSAGEIWDLALELIQERIHAKRIDLRIDINRNDIAMCRLSEISQALFNLLSNACEAIEPLEERWIRVFSEASQDSLIFYIQDSGRGIPNEIAKFMMNPFFTTKDPNKGTGMGLTISRGIAESHKGQIEYLTNRTHTTFRLEISKNLESGVI